MNQYLNMYFNIQRTLERCYQNKSSASYTNKSISILVHMAAVKLKYDKPLAIASLGIEGKEGTQLREALLLNIKSAILAYSTIKLPEEFEAVDILLSPMIKDLMLSESISYTTEKGMSLLKEILASKAHEDITLRNLLVYVIIASIAEYQKANESNEEFDMDCILDAHLEMQEKGSSKRVESYASRNPGTRLDYLIHISTTLHTSLYMHESFKRNLV